MIQAEMERQETMMTPSGTSNANANANGNGTQSQQATRLRHSKCIDYVDKDLYYDIERRMFDKAAKATSDEKLSRVLTKLGRHCVYIKQHNEPFPKKVVYWGYFLAYVKGLCACPRKYCHKSEREFVSKALMIAPERYDIAGLSDKSRLLKLAEALFALSSRRLGTPIDGYTADALKEIVDDIIEGKEPSGETYASVDKIANMAISWLELS